MDGSLTLLGNTGDACLVIDKEQRIVFWNAAARDLFGLDEGGKGKRRCFQVLAGWDKDGRPFCRRRCPVIQQVQGGHLVASRDIVVHGHSKDLCVNVSTVVLSGDPSEGAPWLIHYLRPMNGAGNGASPCEGEAEQRLEGLTRREQEVLALLAEGATTETVAQGLGISTTTVRNHVQHILGKLAAHSRLEAVLTALDNRLLSPL